MKKDIIEVYLTNYQKSLNKEGILISSNIIAKQINKYKNSKRSIDRIKYEIDEFISNYKKSFCIDKCLQTFNYHTHTNRCHHAGISKDIEYVKFASLVGIKTLGFSEHIPFLNIEYGNYKTRMFLSNVDEYIKSINKLKNNEIKILCGFEAEYSKLKEKFLIFLKDKVDYMILGQHFIEEIRDSDYPIKYANYICAALETGIFDIVAHPDIFIEHIDIINIEDKNLYEENIKRASLLICNKSKELNIPLEINLSHINNDKEKYYKIFWSVVEKEKPLVLYGVDAHTPEQFLNMNYNIKSLSKIININNLNFVNKNYDVLKERQKNTKLQELYNYTKTNMKSYEYLSTLKIVNDILEKMPLEFSYDKFCYIANNEFNNILKKSNKQYKNIKKIILTKKQILNSNISSEEINYNIKVNKEALKDANKTLKKQKQMIKRIKKLFKKLNNKIKTKEQLIDFISKKAKESKF